jgi:hypothetical protein
MTRAQVEGLWGPSQTSSLAPNKDVSIYVNNMELVDGKLFNRNISKQSLKVYEVTYTDSRAPLGRGDARVLTVEPVMMPRVGDHVNMFSLFMETPTPSGVSPLGFTPSYEGDRRQVAYFSIPAYQFEHYRELADNPFEVIRVYLDANSNVVGQEFLPWSPVAASWYGFTSAHRYTGR